MTTYDLDKLDAAAAGVMMWWRNLDAPPFYLGDATNGRAIADSDFSPTRNIADAWALVEKAHPDGEVGGFGNCVQIKKVPRGDRSYLDWRCRFMPWADAESTNGPEWSYATTAPIAITLACLRAAGVDTATMEVKA